MDTAAPPLGVVILAAGRGTRMRSERAKVLHPIAGKPLILSVLDAAVAIGPARITVVVGYEADQVQRVCTEHLARRGADVSVVFVHQHEQRGTGDAVRVAEPAFAGLSGDLLILYGDVPGLRSDTLVTLVDRHRTSGAALSLLTATFDDPAGYGRILRGRDGAIAGIVEERDLAPGDRHISEINPGIYCARADFLWPALTRVRADNAQGEFYLTDVVGAAVAAGARVTAVPVADAGEVAGINSRQEVAIMEERVRRALVQRWMREGVTFRDPATAYVEEGVAIGADTEIGPNTQLLGRTIVGQRCRIDGTALLRDATVGDGVHVRLGVVMTDCIVGRDAVVGPFAHLRPGSVLASDVHIGNFVETKNARVGAGSKANHLTYLGDAEIGEHTNIGAGTITCNYDGFAKHRTIIGSRVQIGSDTQLVAPVTVADDTYVAAGTTVTRDVPAGHLVLSRTPQRTVPGWVERRRARARAADGPRAGVPPVVSAKAGGAKKSPGAKRKTPRAGRPRVVRASGGRRSKR